MSSLALWSSYEAHMYACVYLHLHCYTINYAYTYVRRYKCTHYTYSSAFMCLYTKK